MELKIDGKTYKVAFGYNSFCDSDLMDRTEQMIGLFASENLKDDNDIRMSGKLTDLFRLIRDLLFVGFKKYNPVENIEEIGDLLDIYHDEGTEEEPHGLFDLFAMLAAELLAKGFFGDVMSAVNKAAEKLPKGKKKN